MNIVAVTGYLGQDVSLRYTPDGQAVANFSLAVKTGWGENEGTIWLRITVWGRRAEVCNEYLAKGSQVAVDGRLTKLYLYQTQSGEHRATLEVTANNVTFLGRRDEGCRDDGEQEAVRGRVTEELNDAPF